MCAIATGFRFHCFLATALEQQRPLLEVALGRSRSAVDKKAAVAFRPSEISGSRSFAVSDCRAEVFRLFSHAMFFVSHEHGSNVKSDSDSAAVEHSGAEGVPSNVAASRCQRS